MATKHFVRNIFDNKEDFPAVGENNILYEATDTGILYRWNVISETYNPWGNEGELHYIAALSQSGAHAPVPTVIRNDFDDEPVWSYDVVGRFLATLTDIGVGQVRVILPEPTLNLDNPTIEKYTGGVNDDNSIYLNTGSQNTSTGEISQSNGKLYGEGYSYIEIIKYL